MIDKDFDLVTETDVAFFLDAKVPENRRIDYKLALPAANDGDKHKFLEDVSCFANTAGGYLIYGVSETKDANGRNTGIPAKAEGLTGVNPDAEIARLQDWCNFMIAPRIPGLRFRPFGGFPKGPVIIGYIPKSWIAPHMVNVKRHKFFFRTDVGKIPMDIMQIRSAFVSSETLIDRLKIFRQERIEKIKNGDAPFLMEKDCPKIILHLLPVSAFQLERVGLDLQNISAVDLPPLAASGWNDRFNFDGYATFAGTYAKPEVESYAQVFYNGGIEAVDSWTFNPRMGNRISKGYEAHLMRELRRYVKAFEQLAIVPPVYFCLSFLGIKGFTMAVSPGQQPHRVYAIDRDDLILPEIRMDNFQDGFQKAIKQSFEFVWRACGYPKSLNYNDDGEWIGEKID